MSRRLSFTEDRRRKLRRQMELLRLESRTTITEPISFTGLAVSWMVRCGGPTRGSSVPSWVAMLSAASGGKFRRRTKHKTQ